MKDFVQCKEIPRQKVQHKTLVKANLGNHGHHGNFPGGTEEKENKPHKTWPKEADKKLHINPLLSNLADILQPQILHNTSTLIVK